MNIFADDQTNTNQKEIVRESLRTQGIEIGHSIADRLERERQERNKRDADLSAVLSYQDQLEKLIAAKPNNSSFGVEVWTDKKDYEINEKIVFIIQLYHCI